MSKNILKHSTPIRVGLKSSAPDQTENGVIYYNSSDNLFKVYENGQWQNIATRSYADSISGGFDPKESVKVATTTNITLSGTQTIDGIAVVAGDRVLVRQQTTGSQNGIYVVASGAWSRAADFNDATHVTGGEFVFVEFGTTYAATAWVMTTANPTIGTTSLTFAQVQGQAKSLQNAYVTGNIINASTGPVTIAGSESLSVTASNGLGVTHMISSGDGLLVGTLATPLFKVDSSGNLTKINGVSYSFPSVQASGANRTLINDGSGSLTWAQLSLNNASDVTLTSASQYDVLRYDGSKWVNSVPVTASSGSSDANKLIMTNSAGKLDTTFLQYNVNLGGNKLSGVAAPTAASDAVNLSYLQGYLAVSVMTDVSLATTASNDLLRYNGSKWVNQAAISSSAGAGSASKIIMTNSSGRLDTSFLQYNVNLGGNKLSGVAAPTDASDAVNKSYLEGYIAINKLTDVQLTSVAAKDLLRYNGTKWVNTQAVATAGSANAVIMTNSSGLLDQSFLAYNIDFGGNKLSGVANPVANQDAANKAYVDYVVANAAGALTLQSIYQNDVDGGDVTITTSSTDGSLVIDGSESLILAASGGLKLAADGDKSKYVQMDYKHQITLTASSSAVVSALTFDSSTFSSMQLEYQMKEATSGKNRIGTLLIATAGSLASVADTFVETADLGVSWTAALNGSNIELTYSKSTANNALMSVDIKKFMA